MGHKYVKEEDTFNTSQNGTVPKPTAQEVSDNKFLRADGTWGSGAGGSIVIITPMTSSGKKIADYSIDGNSGALYQSENYTQNEQIIGTWMGKPLYQNTYYLNITSQINAGTTDLFNVGTVVQPISLEGFLRRKDNGRVYPLAFANGTTSTTLRYSETGYIQLMVANDNWGTTYEIYVTMKYTKTTD